MYIEDTQTADMSWRRNAIRVADWMEPTSQMRFQFIASDSTHVGEYLDGGSLIEAAVDDFVLYDRMIVNVEELQDASDALLVYPNPASDRIRVQSKLPLLHKAQIQVLNSTGQVVHTQYVGDMTSSRSLTIDTSQLAAGTYVVRLSSDEVSQLTGIVITR